MSMEEEDGPLLTANGGSSPHNDGSQPLLNIL